MGTLLDIDFYSLERIFILIYFDDFLFTKKRDTSFSKPLFNKGKNKQFMFCLLHPLHQKPTEP